MQRDRACAVHDPIPPAMADSVWLGGEAFVDPSLVASASAHAACDDEPDPSWQVI